MEHIGIDLGATHSHLVIASNTGELLARKKIRTSTLPAWLKSRAPSYVVMEACTQSPVIASIALDAQHEVRVIPGQLVRALGVGARGIKTDDRDAEVLAKASVRNEELPCVHLRSLESRTQRELLAARGLLLKARCSIILNVKSWLRGRLVLLRGRGNSRAFVDAVREAALKHPDGLPSSIEALLTTHESLTAQLEQFDAQVKEITKTDPICARLQTIPGVGPQVSLAMKTQLDTPHRFNSASEVASYLALVPGECTTGGKIKRTSTIKAGPRHIKGLLVQAAWVMWRARPNDPVVLWARAIADKRGKRIAIIALARKIAIIIWSMWKHETDYNPSKAARTIPAAPDREATGRSEPTPSL